MIRFSAALVVVAIGVLVGGMAASSLSLVYVAIGLSVVALLTLALGVALKREELFGEQGQSALVGQGANAHSGQEHPGPAVSAERSAETGRQDAFGQQAAAFGQAAWAGPQRMHSGSASPPRTGAGAPWPSPPATPATPATPGPEIPPWRERFASPAPQQQPVAQARADAAETRVDTALTRAQLAKTRTDFTEKRADTTPGRSAALDWFERMASAQPAGGEPVADASSEDHDGDIKTEDADAADSPVHVASVDEADLPAGDANAGTGDATAEAETAEDEEEAETADTDAAADTVVGNTVVEDTVAKPSAVGPDAEAEAEDNTSADAADSSPDADGDQESRSGQREVTVVPGVPRYHDASCILIRFMGDDDLQKMTLDEATEAGCTPCRACMPEHA